MTVIWNSILLHFREECSIEMLKWGHCTRVVLFTTLFLLVAIVYFRWWLVMRANTNLNLKNLKKIKSCSPFYQACHNLWYYEEREDDAASQVPFWAETISWLRSEEVDTLVKLTQLPSTAIWTKWIQSKRKYRDTRRVTRRTNCFSPYLNCQEKKTKV